MFENNITKIKEFTDKLFLQINASSQPSFFWKGSSLAFFKFEQQAPPLALGPASVLTLRDNGSRPLPKLVDDLLEKGFCSLHKIALAHDCSLNIIVDTLTPRLRAKEVLAHGYFDVENRYELTESYFSNPPVTLATALEFSKGRRGLPKEAYAAQMLRDINYFFRHINKSVTIGSILQHLDCLDDVCVVKLIRWVMRVKAIRQVQEYFICG